MIQIIPAILTDSSERFKELVVKLGAYSSKIHLDIADGVFVPSKTIAGYPELGEIGFGAKFDVHLMVQRPQDQIENWFSIGVDRFIIQAESDVDLEVLISLIKNNNRKIGLSLNPNTNTENIVSYLDKIDFVQFMTVRPGSYGGEFVESVVNKILDFHGQYPNVPIMVDGAIHSETARMVISVGASALVVGTHILQEGNDVGKAIEELKAIGNNE